MSHDDRPFLDDDADLSGVEARLHAWRPATGGLSRDRMLYEAGRAAARPAVPRIWFATACLLLTSIGGLCTLWLGERTVRHQAEVALAREVSARRAAETQLAGLRQPGGEDHGLIEDRRHPPDLEHVVALARIDSSSYLALSRGVDRLGGPREERGSEPPAADDPSVPAASSPLRVRDFDARLEL